MLIKSFSYFSYTAFISSDVFTLFDGIILSLVISELKLSASTFL